MSTTTLAVDGMTCGHCVTSVTSELLAIDTVTDVSVELVAGGTSTVTVESSAPLADDALRAAVDEAGYSIASVSPAEEPVAGPDLLPLVSASSTEAAGGCGCGCK